MSRRERIYQELYALSIPFELPAPWDALPPDDGVRAVPEDFTELLRRLLATFEVYELQDAGVAVTTADGTFAPTAALCTAGEPLVFLRPDPNTMPTAVLTATGCLAAAQLPLLLSCEDGPTVQAILASDMLLVTSSLLDLIALRQLGLPATLATGLDRLEDHQIAEVCGQLGWTLPSASRAALERLRAEAAGPSEPARAARRDRELPLCLVMGSPAKFSLDKPSGMEAIIAHFRDLKNYLRIMDMSVSDWTPRQAVLDQLRFQLKSYPAGIDPARLVDEIQASWLDSLHDPLPEPKPRPVPSSFIAGARAYRIAVHNAARGLCTPAEFRQAQEDYSRVLDERLILPLLEETAGPLAQNKQAALMAASRALQMLSPGAEQMLRDPSLIADPETFPDKQLNAIVKLARTVLMLSKETGACQPRLKTPPRPRPAPRRSAGSPGWNSQSRITKR
jgi:hypothetical protein